MPKEDLIRPARIRSEAAPAPSPLHAFVTRLNEYKELIAILAFFIGGFLWVFGYFVTKSQFAELKCYSKNSIIVNRETIRIRDAEGAILDTSRRLEELDEKQKTTPLTDKQKSDRKRFDMDLKRLEQGMKAAQSRYEAAQKKLEDSECLGGEEK